MPATKYNAEADAVLADLYSRFGAETDKQKINTLERELGGPSNFYAIGGSISDEMKLGCLEYEYLEAEGHLQLELA